MKLIKHSVYSGMYYLELEDGKMSLDFYNLTRATELLNRLKNGETENDIKTGFEVHD